MMSSVLEALDNADLPALKACLVSDRALANAPVRQDAKHQVHPIHALFDRVFDGRLTEDQARPLFKALLEAGADIDHRNPRNGDSLLIGAISLSCPIMAGLLLDAGADATPKGLFQATALHWAALMGMPELTDRLIGNGGQLSLRDAQYASTPLGWAIEGWASPPRGNRDGGAIKCARLLVEAGSRIEPQWQSSERILNDADMRAALGL
jgi:hypothetical protein